MLTATDVTYVYRNAYQTVYAVNGVSCTFDPGQMYAIMGASGSGKTARIRETGWWKDLITGEERDADAVQLPPYGYAMLELVHP